MQLVILGFNLTIQSGQAGSMTSHPSFEYSSVGLLTICLAMVAVLFVNSMHIGWMVHSPKTRCLFSRHVMLLVDRKVVSLDVWQCEGLARHCDGLGGGG